MKLEQGLFVPAGEVRRLNIIEGVTMIKEQCIPV
jgi:hypothetical protein